MGKTRKRKPTVEEQRTTRVTVTVRDEDPPKADVKPADETPAEETPAVEDETLVDETPSLIGGLSQSPIETTDPPRWNKQFSAAFDVAEEELRPASVEYDFAAKFLGVDVKDIYHIQESIPGARVGSFLYSLRQTLVDGAYQEKATRNINRKGDEKPPIWEEIQLNSTRSERFLIEGISFYKQPDNHKQPGDKGNALVVTFSPTWSGIYISVYARHRQPDVDLAYSLVCSAWQLAKGENNFLRGEAFSLSGEFIGKTEETWDDVFLTEANTKALSRALIRLNKLGRSMPCRGLLMSGPPGTGKTLSGRVIRNTADATFIWVASRDFWYAGAFGGITHALDLARELAPAVVFFEDIDNWLSDSAVDLLKSEMDGIAQHSGIMTCLTTNYPERLPDALIDRPGRFHDVLKFDLPDKAIRSEMLQRWIPGLTDEQRAKTVKATEGYSGAHLYELGKFADILADEEELSIGEAVNRALEKIQEQRDMITATQLIGSRYKFRKHQITGGIIAADSIGAADEGGPELFIPADKPPVQPKRIAGKPSDYFTAAFQVEKDEGLGEMEFRGYASVFGSLVDSWMPTVIERGAFTDSLKRIDSEEEGFIPILWQHDWGDPVGQSLTLKEDRKGLFLHAKLDQIPQGQRAALQLKSRTIRKMSIGFESEAERFEKKDGEWMRYITQLHLWEVSLVTFAADPMAWVSEAASRQAPLVSFLEYLKTAGADAMNGNEDMVRELVETVAPLVGLRTHHAAPKAEALSRQIQAVLGTRVTEDISAESLLSRVAKQAGTDLATMREIAEGNRERVTAERIGAFAVALGTDLTELLRAASRDDIEFAPEVREELDASERRLAEATVEHYGVEYDLQ